MTRITRRREADLFLRAFAIRLAALYRRVAPGYFSDCPGARRPCSSCAFREYERRGVDGFTGWQSTTNGLVRAIRGECDFVCHRPGLANGNYAPHKQPRRCAGYQAILGSGAGREAERAIHKAAIDVWNPS